MNLSYKYANIIPLVLKKIAKWLLKLCRLGDNANFLYSPVNKHIIIESEIQKLNKFLDTNVAKMDEKIITIKWDMTDENFLNKINIEILLFLIKFMRI